MKRDRVSKVLELKSYRKDLLEMEVRRCREEFEGEVRRLDSLEKGFETAVKEYRERHSKGSISIQELELFYGHLSHLKKRLDRQQETVCRKQAEMEQKMSSVIEADRQKRLVEILHGKLLSEERREQNLLEQREMDFRFITRGHKK